MSKREGGREQNGAAERERVNGGMERERTERAAIEEMDNESERGSREASQPVRERGNQRERQCRVSSRSLLL